MSKKKTLLILAYDSIQSEFENRTVETEKYVEFNEKNGVFITLKKKGQLRGCIGTIVTTEPLYKSVIRLAKAAAFNDYRFKPLTIKEIGEIDISISILTIPKKVTEISEIQLGKHGLIFEYKSYHSVFLPEVSIEQSWSLKEFLQQLSLKAGCHKDMWKKASLSVFSSEKVD